MTLASVTLIVMLLLAVLLLTKPVGLYLADVMQGRADLGAAHGSAHVKPLHLSARRRRPCA
jgi:hypothetical protein